MPLRVKCPILEGRSETTCYNRFYCPHEAPSTHRRLSAKLDRLESLVPVLDTNESSARNWICATSKNASVADGWRMPLAAVLSRAAFWVLEATPWPCLFRHEFVCMEERMESSVFCRDSERARARKAVSFR